MSLLLLYSMRRIILSLSYFLFPFSVSLVKVAQRFQKCYGHIFKLVIPPQRKMFLTPTLRFRERMNFLLTLNLTVNKYMIIWICDGYISVLAHRDLILSTLEVWDIASCRTIYAFVRSKSHGVSCRSVCVCSYECVCVHACV